MQPDASPSGLTFNGLTNEVSTQQTYFKYHAKDKTPMSQRSILVKRPLSGSITVSQDGTPLGVYHLFPLSPVMADGIIPYSWRSCEYNE
jgi:hypothetical protein